MGACRLLPIYANFCIYIVYWKQTKVQKDEHYASRFRGSQPWDWQATLRAMQLERGRGFGVADLEFECSMYNVFTVACCYDADILLS